VGTLDVGATLENEVGRREHIRVRHVDLHLGGRARIDRDVERDISGFGVGGLPHRSGPIAYVVGAIGDEDESLVAREHGAGIDGRQINLVLTLSEVRNLVQLESTVYHDVLRVLNAEVLENISTRFADEKVSAKPTP